MSAKDPSKIKAAGPRGTKYFLLSASLHGLLFALALIFSQGGGSSWHQPTTAAVKPKPEQPKIVEAKAVKQSELAAEVARLNKLDADKAAKARELRRQAERLQKKRQLEEKRLKALKRKQALAEKEEKQKQAARKLAQAKQRAEVAAIEKKREQERQRLEQVKKAREQEEQRLAKAKAKEEARKQAEAKEQQRLAKLAAEKREAQAKARNAQLNKLVDKFGLLVKTKVTHNWVIQGSDFEKACVLRVRLGAGGVVLDVEVLTSSGSQALDRSAIAAIYKSSPLPVPEDEQAFDRMRELRLTLRPEDIIT